MKFPKWFREHLGGCLMKFLKWFREHLFIIIIATVAIIFMQYLVIRWIRYNDTYLYRYLFQDSNGKFAWTGFTAIIAIITLAINAWDNRRKFRADLVSKSRIEWIENVRNTTVSFISDAYEFFIVSATSVDDKNKKENESYNRVRSDIELLKMYFAVTDSDKQGFRLKNCIADKLTHYEQPSQYEKEIESLEKSAQEAKTHNEKLYKILSNRKSNKGKNELIASFLEETKVMLSLSTYIENGKEKKDDAESKYKKDKKTKDAEHTTARVFLQGELDHFTNIISLYLKVEWERAKKGE